MAGTPRRRSKPPSPEVPVSVRRAYCSAVDRNVPVRLMPATAPRDRRAPHDPADLVCLDYQVRCTGWCCPLFSVLEDAGPVLAATGSAGDSTTADSLARKPNPAVSRWNRPT
jgi:hypothetical protein